MTKIEIIPSKQVSQYARVFDETNPNWSKNPEQNKLFLKTTQDLLNEILRSHGHLRLSVAYDYLGFQCSEDDFVVGWNRNSGDSHVDFNINFVNDYESPIILDFNVDGIIYDRD